MSDVAPVDSPSRVDAGGADGPETTSPWRRLHFLATPRWIILILVVILFFCASYFFLAPWQFHRNQQRIAQNQAIAVAAAAPVVSVKTVLFPDREPAANVIWHRASVTGRFDESQQAYVRLRADNSGNPASEVIVPLIMTDGTAVLVDRGYVSYVSVQAAQALPALPAGEVTVVGRVQADETDPAHRPVTIAPDGRKQYTEASSANVVNASGPVLRGFLQLTADSPAVIQAIAVPTSDPGPFFSYAVQWLLFGAIAVLGIGYFIYREFTDPVAGDIYVSEDGTTAPVTSPASAEKLNMASPASPTAPTNKPPRQRHVRFDKSQLYDD